jgi:hypothetical protein
MIFEPFVQGERVSKDIQGTGLGLYITRRLAESFHGGITVTGNESRVRDTVANQGGDGSIFHLHVTLRRVQPSPEDANKQWSLLNNDEKEAEGTGLVQWLRPGVSPPPHTTITTTTNTTINGDHMRSSRPDTPSPPMRSRALSGQTYAARVNGSITPSRVPIVVVGPSAATVHAHRRLTRGQHRTNNTGGEPSSGDDSDGARSDEEWHQSNGSNGGNHRKRSIGSLSSRVTVTTINHQTSTSTTSMNGVVPITSSVSNGDRSVSPVDMIRSTTPTSSTLLSSRRIHGDGARYMNDSPLHAWNGIAARRTPSPLAVPLSPSTPPPHILSSLPLSLPRLLPSSVAAASSSSSSLRHEETAISNPDSFYTPLSVAVEESASSESATFLPLEQYLPSSPITNRGLSSGDRSRSAPHPVPSIINDDNGNGKEIICDPTNSSSLGVAPTNGLRKRKITTSNDNPPAHPTSVSQSQTPSSSSSSSQSCNGDRQSKRLRDNTNITHNNTHEHNSITNDTCSTSSTIRPSIPTDDVSSSQSANSATSPTSSYTQSSRARDGIAALSASSSSSTTTPFNQQSLPPVPPISTSTESLPVLLVEDVAVNRYTSLTFFVPPCFYHSALLYGYDMI